MTRIDRMRERPRAVLGQRAHHVALGDDSGRVGRRTLPACAAHEQRGDALAAMAASASPTATLWRRRTSGGDFITSCTRCR